MTATQDMRVLREFVEAVQERDPHWITACLHLTPPGTMAQIAAGWIAELLVEADEREAEIAELRRRKDDTELQVAYLRMRARAERAEKQRDELRSHMDRYAGSLPKRSARKAGKETS